MSWFKDDPTRLARERRALDDLAADGRLAHAWRIDTDDALLVDVEFEIHGVVRRGVLRYPAAFPYALPSIRPRDPTERWSEHQYGPGGSLCLEWRADNWKPEVTGADLMRSAFKLLATENHPLAAAPVASAHRQSVGQLLRGSCERLVLTPHLVSMLSALTARTFARCDAVRVLHETRRVHFVTGLRMGEVQTVIADLPSGPWPFDAFGGWPIAGLAYRADVWTGHRYLETVEDLRHALGAHGFDPESLGDLANADGQATLILLVGQAPQPVVSYTVAARNPTTLREVALVHSGDSASRLPEDAAALATTRVAVVGVGSLGSKVAVSLARSGVRRFVLVDDDVFLGENIARHDLDWTSVGEHKVAAVADKLRRIAPGMETTVYIENIDGQQSSLRAAQILDDLCACDLIIDATANDHVFLRLAGVARMSKTAMVWGEIYAGGLGGQIARARPGFDPNPLAVRDGLMHHVDSLPEAPFKKAVGYDDTGELPWVAYDSGVSYIAAAMAHLALDTALKRNPSLFAVPAYRFGLRAGWDFSGPFEAMFIELEGSGWDFDVAEHDAAVVTEASTFIAALRTSSPDAPDPIAP